MDNFTCTSCNGTGFWTPCGSQNYRGDRHCYTCNGKVRFKTSSEDRAKALTQRLARKDAKRVANLESGESQLTQALGEHGLAWLEAATWSPFFQDLLSRARRFGSLSDAQLACLVKGYEKSKVRDAERAAEQAADWAAGWSAAGGPPADQSAAHQQPAADQSATWPEKAQQHSGKTL